MEKKKYFIFIIVIVVCILSFSFLLNIKDTVIENFKAIIEIDKNGDMTVSETWIVRYNSEKRVAFRDIGYNKYNPNNPLRQIQTNKAHFNTNVTVEVYGKDGNKLPSSAYRVGYSFKGDRDELGYPVECYPSRSECESIFIQVYEGMQSQMTFKYRYKIEGAVTKYADTAELNWNLLEYFEEGIKDANVEIYIPKATKDDILAWGHGLSNGKVIIEDGKVTLDIDKIRKSEILEFRILFPKDLVDVDPRNYLDFSLKNEIIAYENELAKQTNLRITIANLIFYGTFVLLILMAYIVYVIYNKYDKEHKSNFNAKYYRELPRDYSPAEMSYLYYFEKINDEDLTATLLDLIRRKYLYLVTDGESVSKAKPNFKLVKNKDANEEELLPHEKHLLTWFINVIGNGSEVTFNQIENYPKQSYRNAVSFQSQAKWFVKLAMDQGKKHDFFDHVDKTKAYNFVLIPLIYFLISLLTQFYFNISNSFAIIVSLIITIGLTIYIASIKRRSVNGNEDYVRWKAFKNFLEDFGRMQDYPMPGVVIWEHYLVYATSLKIADKVMEQLKIKLGNIESFFDYNQSTFLIYDYYYRLNYGYTFHLINNSISSARLNSFTTIQSHNASKVNIGGRGGGFSGGSSFGGGGGGFRSR